MDDVGKIWMVRVGDHVMGPYETEAINSLIAAQKISEIDEVALPCKSWAYVRDKAEFAVALQKLRSSSFTKPNTDSLTTSYTGTEKLGEFTESKTQELTENRELDTHTTPLSDFENFDLGRKSLNLDEVSAESSRLVPKKTTKSSSLRFTLLLLLVFLFFGGGYFYITTDLGYNPMTILNKDYRSKFNKSWESGDYTEALKSLKAQKSLSHEHALKYAVLLLLKGNDFESASLALEQAQDKSSAEWKNAKGLIEFKSGRFDSAESLFLSALEQNASYVPALVNLGLLKRRSADWTEARFYFESAYSGSSEKLGQEEVSFYLVESWLQQVMKKDGLTQIEEVRAFLNNRLLGNSTFSHELQLLDIWVNTLRGSWDENENTVLKRFISLDPFILFERKSNPYFHRLGEGEFSAVCDELSASLISEKYKTAAVALCLAINKQYNKSLKALKLASSEEELALVSFISRVNGDDLGADEALVSAMEKSQNEGIVKFFLQARFCFEKGDMKCAAEYWKKALDIDQEAFTAHTGLARAYYEVNDLLKARTFLDRAEVFTDSYGPMIELKHLMSQKNK